MPYRQPWETGHAHVHELRQRAALERLRREAAAAPTALGSGLAALVRRAADALEQVAERLEPRPVPRRQSTSVSSRAGGA